MAGDDRTSPPVMYVHFTAPDTPFTAHTAPSALPKYNVPSKAIAAAIQGMEAAHSMIVIQGWYRHTRPGDSHEQHNGQSSHQGQPLHTGS